MQYRAGAGRKAPTRKLTLGAVGKLTPDEARNLAKKAVGSIAHGLDPAGQRADERKGPHGGRIGRGVPYRACRRRSDVRARQRNTGIFCTGSSSRRSGP